MCQSSVYAISGDREELILEEVASVEVEGDQVVMRPLFGEPLSLHARLVEVDLMKHRIVLERR
ncbi:MAG: CooT family nickel-binding protein [Candidatus Latescibacteria bacterium]|nr:CooT family nickel-binding protein [Candidatus Latescibacterota bacterium]